MPAAPAPEMPSELDLWAPVGTDGMPPELLEAFARSDWARVKELITKVAPRGVYGRQTEQLRRTLPLGVEPALTQLRGWAAFYVGDWDDLERCIAANPVDRAELEILRDTVLGPIDSPPVPRRSGHLDMLARSWDGGQAQRIRDFRHLMLESLQWRTRDIEERGDIDVSRHLRLRRLQDVAFLALLQSLGGPLPVAIALAQDAQRLGDEGDVLRVLAHDVGALARYAAGEDWHERLEYPARLAGPRGSPAIEACNYLLNLCPLLDVRRDAAVEWAAATVERAATRLGAPRLQLRAQTWRVAAGLRGGARDNALREVPGLAALGRRASAGLRAPILLVEGAVSHKAETFALAFRLALESGQIWAELAALAWLVALRPDRRAARDLHRLLRASGWRRLPLVPDDVAAAAGAALAAAGERSGELLSFIALSGRASVAFEVADALIVDARLDMATRIVAAELLARIGTDASRTALRRVAREASPVGRTASALLEHRPPRLGLSERELEVLELAGHGLTNRDIAERLSLSPHTVARHLANARLKLGASNRAEATAKLGELSKGD